MPSDSMRDLEQQLNQLLERYRMLQEQNNRLVQTHELWMEERRVMLQKFERVQGRIDSSITQLQSLRNRD